MGITAISFPSSGLDLLTVGWVAVALLRTLRQPPQARPRLAPLTAVMLGPDLTSSRYPVFGP